MSRGGSMRRLNGVNAFVVQENAPVKSTAVGHAKLDLETLTAEWRVAIRSAEDAVQAAARCGPGLHFPGGELLEWTRRLELERHEAARLLDAIAREEHVTLRRRLDAPWATNRSLGLAPDIAACVFDLEGVLTGSGRMHAAAWTEVFNHFLDRRAEMTGERFGPYRPFAAPDYFAYMHGKPRVEGVHAFLAGRGIRLPEGRPTDPAEAETVYGLANRKRAVLERLLEHEGVTAYDDSRLYLELAREAGLGAAVVTASTNGATILGKAGLTPLVGALVDGNTIGREQLRSSPAPDAFEAASNRLGLPPSRIAGFETTLAGVEACRAAGFGLVVAVERHRDPSLARGADVAVADLAEMLEPASTAQTERPSRSRSNSPVASA